MKYMAVFILALILISCNNNPKSKAQIIVDKAISAHGGEKFDHVEITFDFRDILNSLNNFEYWIK